MAGLANSFGRGAMTNHWIDYQNSDVFFVIGANPAKNHPLAMKWITKARETKGAKLIVVDPRFSKTAAQADLFARHRPGSDIAFLNGLMNYAIHNNLYHHDYVVDYTNASFLINPQYDFRDGLFSGFADGKYDKNSWQYDKESHEEPNVEQVAMELNGFDVVNGTLINSLIHVYLFMGQKWEDLQRHLVRSFHMLLPLTV